MIKKYIKKIIIYYIKFILGFWKLLEDIGKLKLQFPQKIKARQRERKKNLFKSMIKVYALK